MNSHPLSRYLAIRQSALDEIARNYPRVPRSNGPSDPCRDWKDFKYYYNTKLYLVQSIEGAVDITIRKMNGVIK